MNKGLLAALAVVVVGGAAFMLTQEKPAKEDVKVEVSEAEEAKLLTIAVPSFLTGGAGPIWNSGNEWCQDGY